MVKRVRHVWFQGHRAREKLHNERSFINKLLGLRAAKRCCTCNVVCEANRATPVENERAWDQTLEGELLQRWLRLKVNLPLLASVKVLRCHFSQSDQEGATLQPHYDASEVRYGTATKNASVIVPKANPLNKPESSFTLSLQTSTFLRWL